MGGKGKIHEHPKANTNGFDKRPEDAKKGGRKPSIKNQLKDLLKADGQVTIPAKQVIRINDDGSVLMKLPTEMQLAMKLNSIAMSGKNANTLKAIQMIMEQIDGKADQNIKIENQAKPARIKFIKPSNG